jgi:hypothetical protein
MKTIMHRAMLLAVAVTSTSLLGCEREQAETVDTTPTVETTGQAVRVTQVEVGTAVGADKRVSAAATQFRPTDTIYASVVTEGTAASATLTARWTFEDGQVVEESTQTLSPTGTAVTEFHISKPDGFPAGRYRVEILLNGTSTQSKEFEVR